MADNPKYPPERTAGLAKGAAASKAATAARAAKAARGDPEENERAKLTAQLPPGPPSQDELTAIRFAATLEVNLSRQRELRDSTRNVDNAWARTQEINKSLPMLSGFLKELSAATANRLQAAKEAQPVAPPRSADRGVILARILSRQGALPDVSPQAARLARELAAQLDVDDKAKADALLEESATTKDDA
jgi:hypothetical protein